MNNTDRLFLDEILAFINTDSLTDPEFESMTLTTAAYDKDTYIALREILSAREGVSGKRKQLKLFFLSKGVNLDDAPSYIATSNIFIGSSLE